MSVCRYGEQGSEAYAYKRPSGEWVVEIKGVIASYRVFSTPREVYWYLLGARDHGLKVHDGVFVKLAELD